MDAIYASVLVKLDDRRVRGLAEYGVSVADAKLTHLEWLQHLQDELMDSVIYVEKLIQEAQG